MRPFSTGGNYVNFQSRDDPHVRLRDTYRSNFARLVEAKMRYDPTNLFRANRNIVPTGPAAQP